MHKMFLHPLRLTSRLLAVVRVAVTTSERSPRTEDQTLCKSFLSSLKICSGLNRQRWDLHCRRHGDALGLTKYHLLKDYDNKKSMNRGKNAKL